MAKITTIGHTTLDIILFLDEGHLHHVDLAEPELCLPFPSKTQIKRRVVALGGNAPNAGAGLKKLGHPVKLVSRVGDDVWGKAIMNLLQEQGFDLTYTSLSGESDTSIILSFQGDRTILAYHEHIEYPFPTGLDQTDWIYLSSLGFENYAPFHEKFLQWHLEHPKIGIVYNPGRTEIADGIGGVLGIARAVHTLIVNREEAAQILQTEPVDDDDTAGIIKLFDEFIKHGINRVIITDSRRGAYFTDGTDSYYHIDALPNEPADTTGAGDAFGSGYLGAIALGREPLDALRVAVAQSASVVTIPGATHGLLTISEIDERLQDNPQTRPIKLSGRP